MSHQHFYNHASHPWASIDDTLYGFWCPVVIALWPPAPHFSIWSVKIKRAAHPKITSPLPFNNYQHQHQEWSPNLHHSSHPIKSCFGQSLVASEHINAVRYPHAPQVFLRLSFLLPYTTKSFNDNWICLRVFYAALSGCSRLVCFAFCMSRDILLMHSWNTLLW